MIDFLISPFKSVFNIDTYIKATKQSGWKNLLFLFYLLVLTSLFCFAFFFTKMPPLAPFLDQVITNFAHALPNIEIKNGTISANNNEYYEIDLKDILTHIDNNKFFDEDSFSENINSKIVFDTARTEPVYPTQLENEGVALLVTGKNVYSISKGQMQTNSPRENLNLTLNEQFILSNKSEIIKNIKNVIYAVFLFVMPLIIFFIMIFFLVLALLACYIIQLFFARAEVSFGDIMAIACYLLAPVMILLCIIIVLPFSVPMVPFICFALCMIYSQFILTKIKIQKAQENFGQNNTEDDEENN